MAFIAKKMVKSYAFRKETELVNTFFKMFFNKTACPKIFFSFYVEFTYKKLKHKRIGKINKPLYFRV